MLVAFCLTSVSIYSIEPRNPEIGVDTVYCCLFDTYDVRLDNIALHPLGKPQLAAPIFGEWPATHLRTCSLCAKPTFSLAECKRLAIWGFRLCRYLILSPHPASTAAARWPA